MLILWFLCSAQAIAAMIDICRSISSGVVSVMVLPSSILPIRVVAPVSKSIASASMVLPVSWCPTRAMFLILSGVNSFTMILL